MTSPLARRPPLVARLPDRMHVRSLRLGRTLAVGCGSGNHLGCLGAGSVGVDGSAQAVADCRARGFAAYTTTQFDSLSPRPRAFDALLVAHVVEHMHFAEAVALLSRYRDTLRPRARAVIITSQRAGLASDRARVGRFDHGAHRRLLAASGFIVERQYSFPFPRAAGRVFKHNEFVTLATVARGVGE